jgi:hypothetical protein
MVFAEKPAEKWDLQKSGTFVQSVLEGLAEV